MTMNRLGAGRLDAQQFSTQKPARVSPVSTSAVWRYLLLIASALLLLSPLASAQTNWVLVWSDEFNGAAGPFTPTSSNNQFWTFETGQGVFGTGEIENMVSDGTTSFLDGNGHLVIKTYFSGGTYFSARIKTQLNGGTFGKDFTYGRVEASIQIPTSQAIWPAFWMMGDNGVTWPGRGEIDIMEHKNDDPWTFQNLFWDSRTGVFPWNCCTNAGSANAAEESVTPSSSPNVTASAARRRALI